MTIRGKQLIKTQILLIWIFLISYSPLFGQLLWPGDINNNGEVNMVDMLYYGIARDIQGPDRDDDGTEWYGYEPSDPWSGTFTCGTNYCQADVDGKGKVDKKDREAILEDNYGFTHGTVTPDNYLVGNPFVDPTLLIVPQDAAVEPKKKLKVDIFLGDQAHPVNGIFGIKFRLNFNPELVDDEKENDLHKPKKVKFKLKGNTWLNAGGGAKAEDYIRVNNAGFAEVAIMRKDIEDGSASGHGEIGTFEIVMEDIVLYDGETRTLHLSVDKIKMIDTDMNEYPVAGSSSTTLVVEDDHGYLAQAPTSDDDSMEETDIRQVDRASVVETVENRESEVIESGLKIYPNPVERELWIEWNNEKEQVEKLELYNGIGQLVYHRRLNGNSVKESIAMNQLQRGSYWLRITTTEGVSSHLISR